MGIACFVLRRIGFGAVCVFVASVLVFLLTHALGDPAVAILGTQAQQPAVLAAKRSVLGLDRSLLDQYVSWLGGVLHGDLGRSFGTGRAVSDDFATRVVNSLFLMACGALIAIPLALAVGVLAASRRDRVVDTGTTYALVVLSAIPEFVVATALVAVFATGVFHVLPAVSSLRADDAPWSDLDGIVLPALTLAALAVPYVARSMRAAMIEILDSEYVAMARLHGLSERAILWGQALPNAIGPTLQVIALSLSYMTGGVVVVEKVFNYPGIGTALVDAIASHDVPVVQAIAMFLAVLYVLCNLLADIGTVLATPRLRTALT